MSEKKMSESTIGGEAQKQLERKSCSENENRAKKHLSNKKPNIQ